MRKTKIILLGVCALLAIVAIIEQATKNRSAMRLDDAPSPTKIEITGPKGSLSIALDGNDWWAGTFRVNNSYSSNMVNCIKQVKVLDSVDKLRGDDYNARYEMDPTHVITVKAFSGEKSIRTILVGKAGSTGSQSYISLDGNPSILLVQGNYNAVFNKVADDIKDLVFYNLETAAINAVEVDLTGALKMKKETYRVEKTDESLNYAGTDDENEFAPKSEKKIWKLSSGNNKKDLNSDDVNSWVTGLSICNVTAYLSDDATPPGEKVSTTTLFMGDKKVIVDLFCDSITEKDSDGNDKTTNKYYITSNESPHKGEISEGVAEKFKKPLADLQK